MFARKFFHQDEQGDTLFRPNRLFGLGPAYRLEDPTRQDRLTLEYMALEQKFLIPFYLLVIVGFVVIDPTRISFGMMVPLFLMICAIQLACAHYFAKKHGLAPARP